MNATHTLARVETAVHLRDYDFPTPHVGPCLGDTRSRHSRCDYCSGGSKRLPAFGSALIVPPPPDYSTPAAITARCRESGYDHGAEFRTAGHDRTFKKAYREFRTAVVAIGTDRWCRVEDTHVSTWVIERDRDGAFTLIPATPKAAPRRRKVA